MPEDRPEIEIDFEGALGDLESQPPTKASPAGSTGGNGSFARIDRGELTEVIGQMIRPLAVEMEALKRGPLHEHNVLLTAIFKSVSAKDPGQSPLDGIQREVARLGSIEKELQRLGSVETANSKLFDALHAELKTYKDNFLFDSLQRPYIRDLVSLFDDLNEVHEQAKKRLDDVTKKSGENAEEAAFLRVIAGNIENQIAHMVEVFLRMDVEISRTPAGAPHDKRVHRLVSVEPAANAQEDGLVLRSVKPGFFWRERTIRAEDVVVRRWNLPAATPTSLAPTPASANSLPPLPEQL